jgi:hypothetical protein
VISPLWSQLNDHKTLINDQQHEGYSFLALQDNYTSRNLISNNETYTLSSSARKFPIKGSFLLCKITSHQAIFLAPQDNFSSKDIISNKSQTKCV